MALDFAGLDRNPARDRRLRVPKAVKEEPEPPTGAQVLAILQRVPRRLRLPLVTIEQTALRVGETSITWGDVDVDGLRFRLKARATKSRRGKWVPVPAWLMDVIEETCPVEDRLSDVPVFRGVTDDQLRKAMASACKLAGIPSYSPARSAPPTHHALALRGCPASGHPGARRAFLGLDDARHLHARDAGRRARPGGLAGRLGGSR